MPTQLVVLQGDIAQLNVDLVVEDRSLAQEPLDRAYRNALQKGVASRSRSIAFPCIGPGADRSETVQVALETIRDFLKEHPGIFREIIFACWEPENYHLYKEMLGGENRVIGRAS